MKATMSRLHDLGWLAISLALAFPRDARCALEVVPEVHLAAETNDNPRLRGSNDPLAPPESAERVLAEASVSVSAFGPRGDLAFEPAVRSDHYLDRSDDDLQSTDWYLRGHGRRRWQRARLGFSADVAHEKLLGAEFLGAEPGNPGDVIDVDGLLLGHNEIRTRKTFSPYTEIDFGERSHVRLDARTMDVSYHDDAQIKTRTDFTDYELGGAYVRSLDTRTNLSTRLFGGRYEAAEVRSATDTTGIEVRLEKKLSSIWSISAAIGAEQSDYTYFDALGTRFAGSDTHGVLDLDLRKQSERASLTFGLSRRTRPDSFGSVVARSELAASLDRSLSPKLRAGVALRAIRSDAIGTIPGTREYGRVDLHLQWRFKELWSLVSSYRHSYWSNIVLDTNADSNGLIVGVEYQGRSQRSPR